jgi:acyl carrier protein
MADIRAELRQFVIDNFLFGQLNGDFSDEVSFMESGIIDSTGVLELVGFLERRYEITCSYQELIPENLDSIANLTGFVTRKLAERALVLQG